MKTVKTLISTLLPAALLLSSNITTAAESDNNCAVISTKKVPLNRDKRELVLTSHNGKHMFGISERMYVPEGDTGRWVRRTSKGAADSLLPHGTEVSYRRYEKLLLEPGIHHFTAYAANKIVYSHTGTNQIDRSARGGREFDFTINVEAGKHYDLIAQQTYPRVTNPRKRFHPSIMSAKNTKCDKSQVKVIYPAIATDPQVINSVELPQQLTAEFNQLMLEINDYYKQNKPESNGIAISRHATQDYVFGISGARDNQGLKITVVSKSSTAESLGLKKGDILVSVNGKTITADNLKVLGLEIGATEVGENIAFVIQRQGKQMTLNNVYNPAILPAFQLNIDLASNR